MVPLLVFLWFPLWFSYGFPFGFPMVPPLVFLWFPLWLSLGCLRISLKSRVLPITCSFDFPMVSQWPPPWFSVVSHRIFHGFPFDSPLNILQIPYGFPSNPMCVPLISFGLQMIPLWFSVVFQWLPLWFPFLFFLWFPLWFSFWFSKDSLRFFYESHVLSIDFPLGCKWFPFDFLWFSNGSPFWFPPLFFLWFTLWFSFWFSKDSLKLFH